LRLSSGREPIRPGTSDPIVRVAAAWSPLLVEEVNMKFSDATPMVPAALAGKGV
jgi:hypothetical protein